MPSFKNQLLPGDELYFWPVEGGPDAEPFQVFVVAPPRRVGFELGKAEAFLFVDVFDREVGLLLVDEFPATHTIAGDTYILCTHVRGDITLQNFAD